MEKSLRDISWQVPEKTYREDSALSYSMLAKYEREGFNSVSHLGDKLETPSLIFGSAVDAIITGGMDEFNNTFVVMDFPDTSDALIQIAKVLFDEYKGIYKDLTTIPDNILANVGKACNYYAGDKWVKVRVKNIKEGCAVYYKLLYMTGDKIILSTDMCNEVMAAVNALKTSESTKNFFMKDNPFDSIERCYQLKWKATFEGINYRCMMDCALVDHKNKVIVPIDLKTSSHNEWDFHLSFRDWQYMIQARLYYRILKDNIEKDPYFKDFKLANYLFIVVNKKTLTPMVWRYDDTDKIGTLHYGKENQIECRDPFEIGKELNYYITSNTDVPIGINKNTPNDLIQFLNTI